MYVTAFLDGVFATFILQIVIVLIASIVAACRKIKRDGK